MTRGTSPRPACPHSPLLPLAPALTCLLLLACSGDSDLKQAPPPTADAAVGDTAADGQPGADASDAATIKPDFSFATFNVRRFFDTVCDSKTCTGEDFEAVLTQQQFDARTQQVATAIRNFGAAAVGLQEIENVAGMQAIAEKLKDMYPTAVFGETNFPGSLDVGILAAGSVIQIRKHRGVPIQRPDGTSTWFTREFLELHTDWKGTRMVIFTAHFRSKNDDDPGRREAEATTARDIIVATAKEFPDAVVLLGGDLNDTPGSVPLVHLENAGLQRVASDRPLEEVSTYTWNGQLHAIDHIFLAPTSRGVYVPGSARAVRDKPGDGLAGSDHAALVAEFALH